MSLLKVKVKAIGIFFFQIFCGLFRKPEFYDACVGFFKKMSDLRSWILILSLVQIQPLFLILSTLVFMVWIDFLVPNEYYLVQINGFFLMNQFKFFLFLISLFVAKAMFSFIGFSTYLTFNLNSMILAHFFPSTKNLSVCSAS